MQATHANLFACCRLCPPKPALFASSLCAGAARIWREKEIVEVSGENKNNSKLARKKEACTLRGPIACAILILGICLDQKKQSLSKA